MQQASWGGGIWRLAGGGGGYREVQQASWGGEIWRLAGGEGVLGGAAG